MQTTLLELLRRGCIENRLESGDGEIVKVCGRDIKVTTETEFLCPQGHLTVGDVLILAQTSGLSHPDYEKVAKKSGLTVVSRLDRRMLLDYLIGRIDSLPETQCAKPPSMAEPPPDDRLPIDLVEKLRAKAKATKQAKFDDYFTTTNSAPADSSPSIDEDIPTARFEIALHPSTYEVANILKTNLNPSSSTKFERFHDRSDYDNLMCASDAPGIAALNLANSIRSKEQKEAAEKVVHVPEKNVRPYSRYSQEMIDPRAAEDPAVMEATMVNEKAKEKPTKSPTPFTQTTSALTRESQIPQNLPKIPIIIVPVIRSSLISTLNAKDLLGDMVYVSNEEKLKNGAIITNDTLIARKNPDRSETHFLVTGNLRILKQEDWEFRVVAVFCIDADWQFRDFPWNSEISKIFERIKPFYIQFRGDETPRKIFEYGAKIIYLDKNSRIYDKFDISEFWKDIKEHIMETKPYLIK